MSSSVRNPVSADIRSTSLVSGLEMSRPFKSIGKLIARTLWNKMSIRDAKEGVLVLRRSNLCMLTVYDQNWNTLSGWLKLSVMSLSECILNDLSALYKVSFKQATGCIQLSKLPFSGGSDAGSTPLDSAIYLLQARTTRQAV